MSAIRMFAAAAALMMTAVITGSTGAAEQAQQAPFRGWMMGNGMMGPNDMMGYGGPGMMGYYGMGPGMMGGWNGSGQGMCDAMVGHVDGRLAYLRAELKITDAQGPLWKAYAAAARDNANAMLAHCTTVMGQRGTSLSLPERLDQHEQIMTTQLEAVRAMNKTLKPLYAAFSESQKQTADQLFWGPMGMM
jgi:hypothetical protein